MATNNNFHHAAFGSHFGRLCFNQAGGAKMCRSNSATCCMDYPVAIVINCTENYLKFTFLVFNIFTNCGNFSDGQDALPALLFDLNSLNFRTLFWKWICRLGYSFIMYRLTIKIIIATKLQMWIIKIDLFWTCLLYTSRCV